MKLRKAINTEDAEAFGEEVKKRASYELTRAVTTNTIPANWAPHELVQTEVEYFDQARTQAMLDVVFAREQLSANDLHFFRCWAFWRTTRYILSKRRLVQQGETIEEAMLRSGGRALRSRTQFLGNLAGTVIDHEIKQTLEAVPALPEWTNDPEEKMRVIRGHLLLAHVLQISKGTRHIPNMGVLGLKWIDDKKIAPNLFPSTADIVAFENEMLEKAVGYSRRKTRLKAMDWLQYKLGLSSAEIEEVMALLDERVARKMHGTRRNRQAAMILQLEEVIYKAKDSLNLDLVMKALRLKAKVEGLDKFVDEDERDFRKLAAEIEVDEQPETQEEDGFKSLEYEGH